MTEAEHTWSVGRRSVICIDGVTAPHGFFIEIDWQPFVCHPYCNHQAVQITACENRLSPYQLVRHEIAAFFCPPLTETDQKLIVTFEHPDVARVTDYHESIDSREVAICFRRLRIITLDEPGPMRLNNNSAAKVRIDNGYIFNSLDDKSMPLRVGALFTEFEVLAGNCDLGLSMRTLDFEQLSLLRFSGATTEVAIRGLDTNFNGIGEILSAEIADNPIKEWMVRDNFGLRFHTHQSSDAMTEFEILKRQKSHIKFLCRKFMEDLDIGEKIFVYADHLRPNNFVSALSLFLALKRRGGHKMLWVCQNFGETTPGQVDELLPGFARGSLDPFDGPLEGGHITVAGWVNVLFNASQVLNRGQLRAMS